MNFIGNRNFRAGPQTSLEGFICPQNSDKQQKIKVFGRSGGGQKLTLIPSCLYDKLLAVFYKGAMKYCGKHVYLRPSSSDFKGLWNMSVGDYTSIPKGSVFYCTEAPLIIGKKVIFGPRPTIITGDHRIDVIGKYIMDSNDKLPENDAAVVIEDDVWTGANVTILKGVTIGRGSVVAAGGCGY